MKDPKEKKEDGPLAISGAMKEDLKRDNEDHGPFGVSGSMKEDLKRESDVEDRGCFPGFGGDDW